MEWRRRTIVFAMVICTFPAVALIPADPCSGDGMAVYPSYTYEGTDQDPYAVTFESRQLASVTLVNGSYQRIDLFLSIFSLLPDNNLTVIVPIRQRPVVVSSEASTDEAFMARLGYDDVVKRSYEQALNSSSARFADRLAEGFALSAVSTAGTALSAGALHLSRTYREVRHDHSHRSDGSGLAAAGDDGGEYSRKKEVEEVQRYDFEGTSVRVLSVSANATLEDFVDALPGLALPNMTMEVIDEYKGHYALVIDSVSVPPIDPTEYRMLMDVIPYTMGLLIEKVKRTETMSYQAVGHYASQFAEWGYEEIVRTGVDIEDASESYGIPLPDRWNDLYLPNYYRDYSSMYGGQEPLQLTRIMKELFSSVYGHSTFSGNVMSITSKLDEGRMFFPLGTSKGWDNPISRTVVSFRVPDDKRLTTDPAPMYQAYDGGYRVYITAIDNGRPGYDITAEVSDAGAFERSSAYLSMFLYRYVDWICPIVIVLLNLMMFLLLLQIFKKATGDDLKVMTWRNVAIAFSTMVISAPLTFMLFVRDPISGYLNPKSGPHWESFAYTCALFLIVQVAIIAMAVV